MEKIKVSFSDHYKTRTEIFISGKDIGNIFTTTDVHRGIGADYGAVKYQALIAEELRTYDCLSEAGFRDKAKSHKKVGDPRKQLDEVSRYSIPKMCKSCDRKTYCNILFTAQDMARAKK